MSISSSPALDDADGVLRAIEILRTAAARYGAVADYHRDTKLSAADRCEEGEYQAARAAQRRSRDDAALLHALAAALPDLLADRERLDWLQRHAHDVTNGSIGDVTIAGSWHRVSLWIGTETAPRAYGETVREAIDAACRATNHTYGDSNA